MNAYDNKHQTNVPAGDQGYRHGPAFPPIAEVATRAGLCARMTRTRISC